MIVLNQRVARIRWPPWLWRPFSTPDHNAWITGFCGSGFWSCACIVPSCHGRPARWDTLALPRREG